MRTTLT